MKPKLQCSKFIDLDVCEAPLFANQVTNNDPIIYAGIMQMLAGIISAKPIQGHLKVSVFKILKHGV